jgi:hypothetical protein
MQERAVTTRGLYHLINVTSRQISFTACGAISCIYNQVEIIKYYDSTCASSLIIRDANQMHVF